MKNQFSVKKKSGIKKIMPFVIGTCMLTIVASCGGDDDDDDDTAPQQQQQEEQQGTFTAVLAAENPTVTPANGTATVTLNGDDFEVTITMNGAPVTIHPQHVHVGPRCPTIADDTNGDGVIDSVEAGAVYGGVLIPLDNDLSSQDAGGTYPSGASYNYNQSTSFAQMMADLTLPDPDPTGGSVKLPAGENLNLEGRVINIHGISDTETIPDTAQGGRAGFPIACGVLTLSDGGTATTGTTTGGTGTTGTTTGGTGTTTGGTGTTTGGTGTTTGVTGI